LRPGGFMRLGLYSRKARQDINDARKFIAQRGYRPCAEDIRRFRQELIGFGDDTSTRPATESEDFFSTSACRDLLFHVQEDQLTLPEIKAFLSQNRLEFLGLELLERLMLKGQRRAPKSCLPLCSRPSAATWPGRRLRSWSQMSEHRIAVTSPRAIAGICAAR
jgi:hypothetical protein